MLKHLSCEAALLELKTSRKWLHSHVGDSSAWWYHRRLILTVAHALEPAEVEAERAFSQKIHRLYHSTNQCVRVHHQWLLSQSHLPALRPTEGAKDDVP